MGPQAGLVYRRDPLPEFLRQQEQGAKIHGVVKAKPTLSLSFEFRRGNHEIIRAGLTVTDGCRASQLLEFRIFRAENCRVFVFDFGRDEIGRPLKLRSSRTKRFQLN